MTTGQNFFTEMFRNHDIEMRKRVIAHAVDIGIISYDKSGAKFIKGKVNPQSFIESCTRINKEQGDTLLSIINGFDMDIVQLVADEINQLPDIGGCL